MVTTTEPGSGAPDAAAREATIATLDDASTVQAPPPEAASSMGSRLGSAALIAMKAAIAAVAIDATLRSDSPRYRGKAMRTRAVGYVGAVALVPVVWRLLPDRGRYPLGLDLAVSVPLLLDAGGNAAGVYQRHHVDDAVHLANGAIVAGVAGSLVAPHVDEPWQAAAAGAGFGIVASALWEVMEYVAFLFGARGMNLTPQDTRDDLIESTLGALIGGAFALTRRPRTTTARRSGRRPGAVGG
jgi:hypothetical protein